MISNFMTTYLKYKNIFIFISISGRIRSQIRIQNFFQVSRIPIRGKKCRILIPGFSTRFFLGHILSFYPTFRARGADSFYESAGIAIYSIGRGDAFSVTTIIYCKIKTKTSNATILDSNWDQGSISRRPQYWMKILDKTCWTYLQCCRKTINISPLLS